ncbi:hypothetical protein [Microcystis phage Mwe-JY26]
MITFDDSAGVYEVWSDSTASEYLGCADTYEEACEILRKHGVR